MSMADIMSCEDREKPLYLTQIQFLDQQLERCQRRCDELQKQNKDLTDQSSTLEEDTRDISEYLRHSAVETEKKVEELTERLQSQQQEEQRVREELELQLRRQLQELQEHLDELNSQSAVHAAAFEERQELEEQLQRLMQQEFDTEPLRTQLVSEKEEHEAAIDSLETEAELKLSGVAEDLQSVVKDCIQTRVSDLVQEERAQHRELQEKVQILLDECVDLWRAKEDLADQEELLRFEMKNLTKDFETVAQKRLACQKEVEKLTRRCRQLEEEIKRCRIVRQKTLEENETLRRRLASESQRLQQQTAELDELKTELQTESGGTERLKGVLQHAAATLRDILKSSDKVSQPQWTTLQELLRSIEPQGPDSSPGLTSDLRPVRPESLNVSTDPLFLLARYRPGDLGLVPRPTRKHKAAPCRSGAPLHPDRSVMKRTLCRQKTSSSSADR